MLQGDKNAFEKIREVTNVGFHPPSGDNQGVRKENPVRKIGISSLHPSWEGRTQIQFRFLGADCFITSPGTRDVVFGFMGEEVL